MTETPISKNFAQRIFDLEERMFKFAKQMSVFQQGSIGVDKNIHSDSGKDETVRSFSNFKNRI